MNWTHVIESMIGSFIGVLSVFGIVAILEKR